MSDQRVTAPFRVEPMSIDSTPRRRLLAAATLWATAGVKAALTRGAEVAVSMLGRTRAAPAARY